MFFLRVPRRPPVPPGCSLKSQAPSPLIPFFSPAGFREAFLYLASRTDLPSLRSHDVTEELGLSLPLPLEELGGRDFSNL